MDTILERLDNALALQKKQKRSTIAEVNSKVDNLLEVIEKKQKVEYIQYNDNIISNRNKSLSSLEQMDIHKLLGKLPRPEKGFVWPGHKYTGPWNPLSKQLDENDLPIQGQEPVNKVNK